jgi:predicted AAA+ superfamily ATPase
MKFKEYLEEGQYPYIGKVDNKEYSKMLDYIMKKISFLKQAESTAKRKTDSAENMLKHIASAVGVGADDKAIKDSFKALKKVLDTYK